MLGGRWPGIALFSGNTVMTTRGLHKTAVACSDVVLVYCGWKNGGTPLANSVTVNAAIEYGGVTTPVTFGGIRNATLEPHGILVSDPCGVQIPAATEFCVRTAMTAVANGDIPNSINIQGAFGTSRSGGGWTLGSDTADSTGAMGGSDNFDRGGPSLVLGRPLGARQPVIVGLGDSIMRGLGDATLNDRYGGGFLQRAVPGTAAVMNSSVASLPASTLVAAAGTPRLTPTWALGTHALVAQGTNDLFNGRTQAQIQADLVTLGVMASHRGLAATLATIVPRSTSSDSWATTGNQTGDANSSKRVAINN